MSLSAKQRVVVTGIGMVTPIGLGIKENWKNILEGNCKAKQLTGEEYQSLPCKIASKIDNEKLNEALLKNNLIKKSDLKTMSLANLYSLVSADEAIKDCEWMPKNEEESIRSGVSIAIGMSGIPEISEAAIALNNKTSNGYKQISPYFVPKILSNLSNGLISIKYKLKGPNHCVTTACAAGAHSIADAYTFIKNGLVDVMICGGTEACIHPVAIGGFSRMRALASSLNDNPLKASRPFDVNRGGFVMSEGSGCLVLESLDHVKKRNAESKIYAEILGSAINGDANHITNPAPDGDGAYRCMKLALENANLKIDQINHINAHSTSTPAGDLAEIRAIKRLFSQEIKHNILITSLKGTLGHLLGAAGAVESIFTILSCKELIIPPSINIDKIDPEFHLEETPWLKIVANHNAILKATKLIALKNSFGFGGTNASLCISSFTE